MLIFHSVYNFDFLRTAVSINQHWIAACVSLNFTLSIWSMQYVRSAVLLMNTDLLGVMLNQLYMFTHMSKEPTDSSCTERKVTVLPEFSGNKHLQNGSTFWMHSWYGQFYFSSQLNLWWPQHDITEVLVSLNLVIITWFEVEVWMGLWSVKQYAL